MINNILILAAGRGERLGPLTETCPKPLLPIDINGMTILDRLINQLRRRFPSIPIHINISYLAQNLLEHFAKKSIDFRPFFLYENERMGPAGTLVEFSKLISGDILVVNGDLVLSEFELDNLSKVLIDKEPQVFVSHTRNIANARSVISFRNEKVINVTEKKISDAFQAIDYSSDIEVQVLSGIYKLNTQALRKYVYTKGEPLSPNLLNYSIKKQQTNLYRWNDWRISIDSIGNLEEARKKLAI